LGNIQKIKRSGLNAYGITVSFTKRMVGLILKAISYLEFTREMPKIYGKRKSVDVEQLLLSIVQVKSVTLSF
jgi:hypothetical protein